MNQSKKITDGALLTAVYIVLLLIVVFIPIIQLFGLFILPVPFIMYAAKYGFKPSIIMLIVSIILSLIFATAISLPITILAGVGGIVVGSGIYRKKNAYEIWAQGTVGFIIGFVVVLALLQFVFAINIFTEMDMAIKEAMEMSRSLLNQFNIGEEAREPLKVLEEQMLQFKDLIPSSIAIASMLFAFLGQWVSYKVMNRIENKQFRFPAFKDLNFPVIIIWIYFFALILSFMDLDTNSVFYMVLVNVMALTIVFIVIQGFSFVFFYMDHKNIHQSVPIIIVIITLFLPFLFMFIIRIIGIIDLGFSLKKRIAHQKR